MIQSDDKNLKRASKFVEKRSSTDRTASAGPKMEKLAKNLETTLNLPLEKEKKKEKPALSTIHILNPLRIAESGESSQSKRPALSPPQQPSSKEEYGEHSETPKISFPYPDWNEDIQAQNDIEGEGEEVSYKKKILRKMTMDTAFKLDKTHLRSWFRKNNW